jgi:phenylacetate-CoA ligase
LFQLEQSQWWSPEKLRRAQFVQALKLLQHARKTVPFYRDSLAFLEGVSELTEDLWQRIPILTRQDVQHSGKQLQSTSIPPSHGNISDIRTSGSTGLPIRVWRTDTALLYINAFSLREYFWIGQDHRLKLAAIRSLRGLQPGRMKIQGTWGPPLNWLFYTGRSAMMEITTDIDTQIRNLVQFQPEYLITYPSNLQELLRHEEIAQIRNLKLVRTLSESLPDGLREDLKAKLGAALVDIYSTNEIGALALQCPECDHYHIQSEHVLLEVLREDGSACEPGEIGRVVITSLHNFAMPLVRYSILDYAEPGEPCPCGRGLPVLKRILGRSRNLVAMPDGTRVWPAISVAALTLAEVAPISQVQLIQHSVARMEARLVTARRLTVNEEQQVVRIIQESLRHPFHIQLTYLDAIPRSGGGKFETFISLV